MGLREPVFSLHRMADNAIVAGGAFLAGCRPGVSAGVWPSPGEEPTSLPLTESLLPSPQRPEAALDTRELGEEWGPLTAGWTGPVCIGFKRRNLTRNLTLREGAEHSGSRSGLLRSRRCPGLDMRPWHVFHFSQSQGLPW